MTLDQITTFLKVYQVGSFQEAAEQLYLPQPTVSHRINQLERELGKPLLIRGKGKVRLTEEGKAFLPYARSIVGSVKDGREAVNLVKSGEKGKLSIGCNNSFAGCIMPEVIDTFTDSHPGISVKVYCYASNELVRLIKNRVFQLGITRYTSNDAELIYKPVYRDRTLLYTSPAHRFAKRGSVSLEEALREPLIAYQKETQYRQLLELTLGQLNLSYKVKYETNNLQLIKHFIRSGSGVHFSGQLYMRHEVRNRELIEIEIEDNPFPPSQIFIVYRDGELNSIDHLFIKNFEHTINDHLQPSLPSSIAQV